MTEFFIDYLGEVFSLVETAYILLGCAVINAVCLALCLVFNKRKAFYFVQGGTVLLAVFFLVVSRLGLFYSVAYITIFALLEYLMFCVNFFTKRKEKSSVNEWVKDIIKKADQDKFDGGLDDGEWAKICDGLDDEFPLKEATKSQKKGAEDSLDGLSVSHAKSLIDKLSLCKLTPSERAGLKDVYDSLSSCKDKAILSEKLNYLVLLYARHCG